METKIVHLPELKLVGIPLVISKTDGGFGKAWDLFAKYNQDIQWKNNFGYGVELYSKELMSEHKWYYMAAMEVDRVDIPSVYFAKTLPKNTYIVATCKANSMTIGKTLRELYDTIIPQSNYRVNGHYDFEFYGDAFKGMDVEDSYLDLYIPVIENK